jgi:hypothetical protein
VSCAIVPNVEGADKRISKIFADWETRQQQIQSIRYKIRGDLVLTKGSARDDNGRPLSPPSPPRDIHCPFEWVFLFDLASDLYRIEVAEQIYDSKNRQFDSRSAVTCFNGKQVRRLYPRSNNTSPGLTTPPSNPDMIIISGNMRGFNFEAPYLPLFFAHGIIRTSEHEIVSGKFKEKPGMDYFHVHGSGVHGGRTCLVLRTETLQMGTSSFDELWVDPGRDSAIVRYIVYSGGKPFSDTVVQYGKTTQSWLPKSWTFTSFTDGKTDYFQNVTVENSEIEPAYSGAEFELEPSPGMLIQEFHNQESPNSLFTSRAEIKSYRAGELAAKIPFIGGIEGRGWSLWWLIPATALAGLFVWFLWRNAKLLLRKRG